jgi:hypothetical protein
MLNAPTGRQRSVGEHFRLLFTLIHALGQSGATVHDTEDGRTLDAGAAIVAPAGGPPRTYAVTLSDAPGELLTQVHLLRVLLVADAQVRVRYQDHEGEHEEEIATIGWADPAQLTTTPIAVMPRDYRGLVRLFPQGCTFLVKI